MRGLFEGDNFRDFNFALFAIRLDNGWFIEVLRQGNDVDLQTGFLFRDVDDG